MSNRCSRATVLLVGLVWELLLRYKQRIFASGIPDDLNCSDTRLPKQHLYNVIVTERNAVGNDGAALISKTNGSSEFQYNFNAAWFSTVTNLEEDVEDGLIVRLVDWDRHPEWANAGAIAIVRANLRQDDKKPMTSARITEQMVTWAGSDSKPSSSQVWGAVDPRMTYRPYNQQYYLTWDNCTKNCWPQRKTYLSTSPNPLDPDLWTFHGAVFPFPYTSGAALLFRDDPTTTEQAPHVAFVCNSNTADTIFLVESWDGLHWKVPEEKDRRVLMKGRPGCWDASGVAVGPQPEQLSTGDYLLIYNIDTGFPYHPNPLGRCAIGWAILDGKDPSQIVARSQRPLLTATLSWERCLHGKGPECQVPEVVFSTGLKPLRSTVSADIGDEFYIIYGGADSVVGVTKIQIDIQNDLRDNRALKKPGQ